MIYLLTTVHVIVCLFLIGVVLLQTGKRADLAGAFGGGGSQTAFGTRGAATFLTKLTTTFAVLFMMTTIGLSVASFRAVEGGGGSVLDGLPPAATTPATVPPPPADVAPVPDPTEDDGTDPDDPPVDPPADPPGDGSEEP